VDRKQAQVAEQGLVTRLDERGVGWLTINRPDRMNALDGASADQLVATLAEWSESPDVRVVVITGVGKAFSTGADIVDMAQAEPPKDAEEAASRAAQTIDGGSNLARAVRDTRVPVIAAVNGAAAGVGASLAIAADLIYASEKAYFLLPFVNIGLMPDGGATATVAAAIGRARAAAVALLGEKLSAGDAFAAGLITAVVAPDELDAVVDAAAEKIAAKPRRAMELTKAALNGSSLAGLEDAFARERSGQIELLQSDEFRSAIAQFSTR